MFFQITDDLLLIFNWKKKKIPSSIAFSFPAEPVLIFQGQTQTRRQSLGERGSRKQRYWDVSVAEGAGQGCFQWLPALCLDEYTAGFHSWACPPREIISGDHPSPRTHVLLPWIVGWTRKMDNRLAGRRKTQAPPCSGGDMPASLLLFGASKKPCGLWEFTRRWVRAAWRKRGGTITYTFCMLGGSTFPWDLYAHPHTWLAKGMCWWVPVEILTQAFCCRPQAHGFSVTV